MREWWEAGCYGEVKRVGAPEGGWSVGGRVGVWGGVWECVGVSGGAWEHTGVSGGVWEHVGVSGAYCELLLVVLR